MSCKTAPNSARMLEILRNYHNWLNARSPLEIADVRKLPADQRIDKIRELQLRDEEQWVKQYRFPSHMAEDFRRVLRLADGSGAATRERDHAKLAL